MLFVYTLIIFILKFKGLQCLNMGHYGKIIMQKVPISDLVRYYSDNEELKSTGGDSYKCLCPFHDDKNPSMSINDNKNVYNCFSCGACGNSITFIREIEGGISYPEAIKKMIKIGNLNDIDHNLLNFPKVDHIYEHNKNLSIILNKAEIFYSEKFRSPGVNGEAQARNFCIQRNLKPQTVLKYGIGFAPQTKYGQIGDLITNLTSQGYLLNDIITSGLLKNGSNPNNSNQNHIYERFRKRLMIPIRNPDGSVVGFGGRHLDSSISLNKDDDVKSNVYNPKYLNSPETPLFKKGNLLYGLDVMKKDTKTWSYEIINQELEKLIIQILDQLKSSKNNNHNDENYKGIKNMVNILQQNKYIAGPSIPIVLVEGYFDVISLNDIGIPFVAGALGTAITREQIILASKQLSNKNVNGEVILLLDHDEAGKRAAYRVCMEIAPTLPKGINLKIASIPDGLELVAASSIIITKKNYRFTKKNTSNIVSSLSFIENIIETIDEIKDASDLCIYFTKHNIYQFLNDKEDISRILARATLISIINEARDWKMYSIDIMMEPYIQSIEAVVNNNNNNNKNNNFNSNIFVKRNLEDTTLSIYDNMSTNFQQHDVIMGDITIFSQVINKITDFMSSRLENNPAEITLLCYHCAERLSNGQLGLKIRLENDLIQMVQQKIASKTTKKQINSDNNNINNKWKQSKNLSKYSFNSDKIKHNIISSKKDSGYSDEDTNLLVDTLVKTDKLFKLNNFKNGHQFHKKYGNKQNINYERDSVGIWSDSGVTNILQNPSYTDSTRRQRLVELESILLSMAIHTNHFELVNTVLNKMLISTRISNFLENNSSLLDNHKNCIDDTNNNFKSVDMYRWCVRRHAELWNFVLHINSKGQLNINQDDRLSLLQQEILNSPFLTSTDKDLLFKYVLSSDSDNYRKLNKKKKYVIELLLQVVSSDLIEHITSLRRAELVNQLNNNFNYSYKKNCNINILEIDLSLNNTVNSSTFSSLKRALLEHEDLVRQLASDAPRARKRLIQLFESEIQIELVDSLIYNKINFDECIDNDDDHSAIMSSNNNIKKLIFEKNKSNLSLESIRKKNNKIKSQITQNELNYCNIANNYTEQKNDFLFQSLSEWDPLLAAQLYAPTLEQKLNSLSELIKEQEQIQGIQEWEDDQNPKEYIFINHNIITDTENNFEINNTKNDYEMNMINMNSINNNDKYQFDFDFNDERVLPESDTSFEDQWNEQQSAQKLLHIQQKLQEKKDLNQRQYQKKDQKNKNSDNIESNHDDWFGTLSHQHQFRGKKYDNTNIHNEKSQRVENKQKDGLTTNDVSGWKDVGGTLINWDDDDKLYIP